MAPRPRTPPTPTLPAECPCPARPESHSARPQPPAPDPQPWFPRLFFLQRKNKHKETESGSRTRIFSWFLVTQSFLGSGTWIVNEAPQLYRWRVGFVCALGLNRTDSNGKRGRAALQRRVSIHNECGLQPPWWRSALTTAAENIWTHKMG